MNKTGGSGRLTGSGCSTAGSHSLSCHWTHWVSMTHVVLLLEHSVARYILIADCPGLTRSGSNESDCFSDCH